MCRQQESCMHERRLILAKGRLLADWGVASIVHSHKELFHLMQGWSFVVHCTSSSVILQLERNSDLPLVKKNPDPLQDWRGAQRSKEQHLPPSL